MAKHCEECKEKPDTTCENALAEPFNKNEHKPITIHDHEYDEWYCKNCWMEYSDEERGLDWHNVVEETNGETYQESRTESQGATS